MLLLLLVPLVGRPVATDDLWFHLKMGEVYGTETLWPDADPMLHTAGDRRPVQHEWLFGVAAFGLERAIGLQGLRIVHLIAVLGIVLLVFASFRRESGAALPAIVATCIFLVLSWRRLYQLRPDLVSIAAAIAIYQLLLAPGARPAWGRVGLATGLVWVWANLHSLFAVGLALGMAGWLGIWLKRGLETRLPPGESAAPTPAAGRVGAAIGLGLLAASVNPRGIAQHLTFFSSTRDSAIWLVKDEWTPFDPFSIPGEQAAGIDPLAWLAMDALLLLLVIAAVAGGIAFLRRPTADRLRAADPVLGALAFASAAAILVSLRFLWMGFFILLFLLRAHRWGLASHPVAARRVAWAMAGAVLLLSLGFARMDTWEAIAGEIQREPGGYFDTPYLARRYCASGIRVLEEAGLEGKLFNPYHVGGYAGYRLAPRIRTFIDGRTEHYPAQVMQDYLEIVRASTHSDPSEALQLLDERDVDIFLGVGLPEGYYSDLYTVELLARRPGWILVYRSVDHAIYLRRDPRNSENLWRLLEYYHERGVPFDFEKGFSPRDVIREAPDWAVAEGMIEPDFAELAAQRESADPEERYRRSGRDRPHLLAPWRLPRADRGGPGRPGAAPRCEGAAPAARQQLRPQAALPGRRAVGARALRVRPERRAREEALRVHPRPALLAVRGRLSSLLGPLSIVGAFALLAWWSWAKWTDVQIDFGLELYLPWQLSQGKALYRDIAYRNGPLSPYLNALWFRLFGVSLQTLVWCNLAILAGICALTHHLLRRSCDRFTAAVGCLVLLGVFGFSQYVGIANYNYVTPYQHAVTHGLALSLAMIAAICPIPGDRAHRLARPRRDLPRTRLRDQGGAVRARGHCERHRLGPLHHVPADRGPSRAPPRGGLRPRVPAAVGGVLRLPGAADARRHRPAGGARELVVPGCGNRRRCLLPVGAGSRRPPGKPLACSLGVRWRGGIRGRWGSRPNGCSAGHPAVRGRGARPPAWPSSW